jgi:hypothetical protein
VNGVPIFFGLTDGQKTKKVIKLLAIMEAGASERPARNSCLAGNGQLSSNFEVISDGT